VHRSAFFFKVKRSKDLTVRDLGVLNSGVYVTPCRASVDPHTFKNRRAVINEECQLTQKTQPSIPSSLKFSWFLTFHLEDGGTPILETRPVFTSRHGVTSQQSSIFRNTAVRTSNITSFIPPLSFHFYYSHSLLPIFFFLSPLCRVSFSNTTIEQSNTLIVTTVTDKLQHSILRTRCLQTSQRNQVGWGDICKYTQYILFSSDTPQCTYLYDRQYYITSMFIESKNFRNWFYCVVGNCYRASSEIKRMFVCLFVCLHVVYLTSLLAAEITVWHWLVGWLNNELERIWKGSWPNLKYCSGILHGVTE